MRDFRDLKVWEKAYALALATYRTTKEFPREEQFGLTSQVRRAGTSIVANIAEGCGRDGEPELARFLNIAMGSASELECHLMLARDLSFLKPDEYARLENDVTEVKRMLTSFIQKLRAES